MVTSSLTQLSSVQPVPFHHSTTILIQAEAKARISRWPHWEQSQVAVYQMLSAGNTTTGNQITVQS
ncbi:hypothetical protein E2C01_088865 [Portunus trituberculatus]|uniref:Uncharacterized protein n=1 Tax=Portunus trituberculatus TaxID=210409 RepID=A0A5B7JGL6_PORTR|nr:hypothetical protein [Portunus trituberculatus]